MRQVFLFLLAGLIVAAGLVLANWRVFSGPVSIDGPAVLLDNLPASYCPTQAEIFHTSRQTGTLMATVVGCRIIELKGFGLTNLEKVYIKLPKALAFSIQFSEAVDQYVVGLRVGDTNGDNAINETDEQLITEEIFTGSNNYDVDLDGKVTSNDLTLSKINAAVGEVRPNNGRWQL
jgi:hypothetical protein